MNDVTSIVVKEMASVLCVVATVPSAANENGLDFPVTRSPSVFFRIQIKFFY